MQCQRIRRDLRPYLRRLQTQRASGRLHVHPRRELLQSKQFEGIVTPVDRALDHVEQRTVENCRRVVEMNVAELKARQQPATGTVEFQLHL